MKLDVQTIILLGSEGWGQWDGVFRSYFLKEMEFEFMFSWMVSKIIPLLLGVKWSWGFPGGSDGKASSCNAGDPGLIPGWGRSPGGGNTTHFSILAWRIPWTKEPGRLQPMGSQRGGHEWASNTFTFKNSLRSSVNFKRTKGIWYRKCETAVGWNHCYQRIEQLSANKRQF